MPRGYGHLCPRTAARCRGATGLWRAMVFAAGLAAAPEALTRDSLLFPLKIEGGKWGAAGDPMTTAAFDS